MGVPQQRPEHVLQVAHDLFCWNGIRATGIDKVSGKAAVVPTTLYRLFGSKDDLVAAYVERADQLTREWITAAIESGGQTHATGSSPSSTARPNGLIRSRSAAVCAR
jgi:AcrR family transcriptional regulator